MGFSMALLKAEGSKPSGMTLGMAMTNAMSGLCQAERLGEIDKLAGAVSTVASSSLMEVGMASVNNGGGIRTARVCCNHSEVGHLPKADGVFVFVTYCGA